MMRLVGIAMVVFLLTAAPALAAPNTSSFLRYCEARIPVATCGCMANEMSRTRRGQVALDTIRLGQLPRDRQQSEALALANKYGMKYSEIVATLDNIDPYIREIAETCK